MMGDAYEYSLVGGGNPTLRSASKLQNFLEIRGLAIVKSTLLLSLHSTVM